MAEINHSSLVDDSKIHQPRGASTAAANTWLRANGDGTTSFTTLPADPTYTFAVEDSLTGSSFVDQELTSNGDESEITFGAAQTSPNGALSLAANGDITINEDGVYAIVIARNAGRSTNSGINSVAFSSRLNGVQAATSSIISLDNSDAGTTVGNSVSGIVALSAGDVVSHHMLYASGNSGNVGVYTQSLTPATWEDVPSARVTITKLGIV